MGDKTEEYEKAIKDIGQIICLDKDLELAQMVTLMDLMKRTGETAIGIIAGDSSKQVFKLLKKASK